jgi:hypothetical protein
MQMYNFDFMEAGNFQPIETANSMQRSLAEAKNRCRNLYAAGAASLGASSVRLRQNGGATILYSWPEDS